MLEGSHNTASLFDKKDNVGEKSEKLDQLKQQIHIRKIQKIEESGKSYHDQNSQFGMR